MPNLQSLASTARQLVGVAWRSFLKMILITLAMGVVLGAGSYVYLREQGWVGPVIGLITVAEALAAGIVLGTKHGFVMALIQGVRDFGIAGAVVRVVFDRLLQVDVQQEFGERGGLIAQGLERLPLSQAEQLLSRAIKNLVNAPSSGRGVVGWFQRLLESRLLRAVEKYTLERFRDEEAKHGGIDLVKVRTHLETDVDELLVAKLRIGVRLWTVAVLVGMPVVVLGQAWAVLAISK